MNNIQRAIDVAGSITSLANDLGVTPQAICFWRDGKRKIPADKCPLIELVTGVTCESLRPDVAWSVLRNKPELAQVHASQAQPATESVAHGVVNV